MSLEARTLYAIGLPEPGSDKLLVADPKPFPDGTHQEVGRLVPATVDDLDIEAMIREAAVGVGIAINISEATLLLRAALGGTQ